jgi:single-strand DNA-binding protein
MAYNNTVTLIGNMGSEARIIATDEYSFAGVSVATTDSYQDKEGNWQEKETIWHSVVAFNPRVMEELKSLKTGTRIKITGSLSYRPFEVVNGDGELISKKDASIIVGKVELAPLPKKNKKEKQA